MAMAGTKEMSFERGRRIFLGPKHWAVLLRATDEHVMRLVNNPFNGDAVETLRLLVQANELKRFIIEVENGKEVMRVSKQR
jgi:hypothetical protein